MVVIKTQGRFGAYVKRRAFHHQIAHHPPLPPLPHPHHPKWTNVYNKIEVELFTHDNDGLTEKDFTLAKEMDNLFKNYE